MFIPVILGTAREGRQSEKVARFVLDSVSKAGIETELIDVKNYRIPATDNSGKSDIYGKLSPKLMKADGFIIVTPEYNHGYPGELKMFLDMFYAEWARKPLGLAAVSIGPFGGARVVEQLREVAAELHMADIREVLHFPFVQNLFDEKGIIKDASAYEKRIKTFLDELSWYANALKTARK
jgi:NAD(P)H-dependent FMN reductase